MMFWNGVGDYMGEIKCIIETFIRVRGHKGLVRKDGRILLAL